MPMSNLQRSWWHIGVASGVLLLALALGMVEAGARSPERDIGSGAIQKSAPPVTRAPETREVAPLARRTVGARNHDPCCADEPPVPRARVGATTTKSRVAAATLHPQPSLPGTSLGASPATPDVRPTGARSVKRNGEAKPAPRSKPGEQRRGGVGALIGITFA